jgi:hypothetical protein
MYVPCIVYNLLFRPTNKQYINSNVYYVKYFRRQTLLLIYCVFVGLNNKLLSKLYVCTFVIYVSQTPGVRCRRLLQNWLKIISVKIKKKVFEYFHFLGKTDELNASIQTSRRENDNLIKNDCSNTSMRKSLVATGL